MSWNRRRTGMRMTAWKWVLVALAFVAFARVSVPEATAKVGPGDGNAQINQRCSDKWPANFRMQKYCRKQQTEGRSDVSRWLSRHKVTKDTGSSTVWGQMFRHCGSKWNDAFGPNWRMIMYCLKQQESAYRDL